MTHCPARHPARGDVAGRVDVGVLSETARRTAEGFLEGLDTPLDAAARCVEGDLEKDITCVLKQLGGERSDDDICMLALRVL